MSSIPATGPPSFSVVVLIGQGAFLSALTVLYPAMSKVSCIGVSMIVGRRPSDLPQDMVCGSQPG